VVWWNARIVFTGTQMHPNWTLIDSAKVAGRWQHYYLKSN